MLLCSWFSYVVCVTDFPEFLQLWFPLYSVLQNRDSADIAAYNTSTIQRYVHNTDVDLILV